MAGRCSMDSDGKGLTRKKHMHSYPPKRNNKRRGKILRIIYFGPAISGMPVVRYPLLRSSAQQVSATFSTALNCRYHIKIGRLPPMLQQDIALFLHEKKRGNASAQSNVFVISYTRTQRRQRFAQTLP